MLFMGQEFLEDKLCADNPNRSDLFLWWDGVQWRIPQASEPTPQDPSR